MDDGPSGRSAAVVLNWNGGDLTCRCLADLRASERPVHVVAVDNGSTDGSAERLHAAAGPDLTVVRLPRNLGFSAGMNAGVRRALSAGCRYLWLLNNDVSIPPAAHAALVDRLESLDREALITPRLAGAGGGDQHIGGSYACDGSRHRLLTCDDLPAVPAEGTWLTGTALFCRASTAARIGPFDERFFAYWEDVDWSFRARRVGIHLATAPEVTVTHHARQGLGGYGSHLAAVLLARNEFLFLRRHVRGRARLAAFGRVLARQWRLAALLARRADEDIVRAHFTGIVAGLLGLSGRPRAVRLPRRIVRTAMTNPLASARWLERVAARLDPPAPHATMPAARQ
jgi:GT2 family glycosyltransferase